MEEWIHKTTAKISRKIKQKSMQIANWILNEKIKKKSGVIKEPTSKD